MFRTAMTPPQIRNLRAILSRSPDETREEGRKLASLACPGDLVLLHGEMGAGKTVFARGFIEGLGAASWRGSPTFAIVNEYATRPRLLHLDLYRLSGPEVEDLGLDDSLLEETILLCEWPERAGDYLRSLAMRSVIEVTLEYRDGDTRSIRTKITEPVAT